MSEVMMEKAIRIVVPEDMAKRFGYRISLACPVCAQSKSLALEEMNADIFEVDVYRAGITDANCPRCGKAFVVDVEDSE